MGEATGRSSLVTKLSTAARVAHDLGLAACFGGTLFGKIAFNPSVGVVASKPERGRLGGTSWNRFNALNTASFVLAVATWLSGRSDPRAGAWIGERETSSSPRMPLWVWGLYRPDRPDPPDRALPPGPGRRRAPGDGGRAGRGGFRSGVQAPADRQRARKRARRALRGPGSPDDHALGRDGQVFTPKRPLSTGTLTRARQFWRIEPKQ